jgi:hypothetical protein
MSQLGRISGQLLKDNLTRNGHDLTFDNDLLHLDVNNRKIGIKTVSPETELDVNGTTRTTDLEVTTQADIADLTILGNTITSNNGILNLSNGAGDHVTYQAKLIVDNVEIENTFKEKIKNTDKKSKLEKDLLMYENKLKQENIKILTAKETQIFNMLGKTKAIDTVHSYLTDTLNKFLACINFSLLTWKLKR